MNAAASIQSAAALIVDGRRGFPTFQEEQQQQQQTMVMNPATTHYRRRCCCCVVLAASSSGADLIAIDKLLEKQRRRQQQQTIMGSYYYSSHSQQENQPHQQQQQQQQRERNQRRHQQRYHHRNQWPLLSSTTPLLTAFIIILTHLVAVVVLATGTTTGTTGGGYLIHPPSRNYLAYLQNNNYTPPSPPLPSSSTTTTTLSLQPLSILPEKEPTPHNLNSGKMCGTVDGAERDYNMPMSRGGVLLPLNIQAVYNVGSTTSGAEGGNNNEINVKLHLFNTNSRGGHFEFSACPLTYPNIPTEECFQTHPLEFVKDEYYGAVKDEMFPERIHVPYPSAFEGGGSGGRLKKVMSNDGIGPGGATMTEFSYTLRLPTSTSTSSSKTRSTTSTTFSELVTDMATLEKHGVPNGNLIEGSTFVKKTITTLAGSILENRQNSNNGGGNGVDDVVATNTTGGEKRHSKTSSSTGSNRKLQQQLHPSKESKTKNWIATQTNSITTKSPFPTVLISSLTTDGNGTTTIITLNGQTTIIRDGPKVPASSTLTYGSKDIYGGGIIELESSLPDLVDKDDVVKDVMVMEEEEERVNGQLLQASAGRKNQPLAGGGGSSAAQAFASGKSGGGGDATGSVSLPSQDSVDNNNNMIPTTTTTTTTPSHQYILLRWHYITARDCHPPGYDTYPWPTDIWGEWKPQWGGECNLKDGGGVVEEYWNCAEILILGENGDGDVDGDGDDGGGGGTEDLPPFIEPQAMPQQTNAAAVANNVALPPPIESKLGSSLASSILTNDDNNSISINANFDQYTIFAKDDRASTTGTTPVLIDVTRNDAIVGNDNDDDSLQHSSLVVTKTGNGRHGTCVVTEDNNLVEYTLSNKLEQDAGVGGFGGRDRCAYMVCLVLPKDDDAYRDRGGDGGGVVSKICDEGWIYIQINPSGGGGGSDAGEDLAASISQNIASATATTNNDGGSSTSSSAGSPPLPQTTSSSKALLTPRVDSIMAINDSNIRTNINTPIHIDVAANDEWNQISDDRHPQITQITKKAMHGTCQVITSKVDDLAGDDGTTTNNGNGDYDDDTNQVLYTPTNDFRGYDTCTYKICLWGVGLGNNNVCDTAEVMIMVGDFGMEEEEEEEEEEEVEDDPPAAVVVKPRPAAIPPEPEPEPKKPKPEPEPEPEQPTPKSNQASSSPLSLITPNSDPTANRDMISVLEGTHVDIDVLSNDEDADGDKMEIYSWTIPQSGRGSRVEKVVSGGDGVGGSNSSSRTRTRMNKGKEVLRYTPREGFVGRDAFKVTICDTTNRCDTSRVDITVISQVFAMDDEATTAVGSPPIVIDVLANDDSSSANSINSSKKIPLMVTSVSSAKHGKCEDIGNNKVRYTPPDGNKGGFKDGWDRCSYIVCSTGVLESCDKGRVEVRVLPNPMFERPKPEEKDPKPPRPIEPEEKEVEPKGGSSTKPEEQELANEDQAENEESPNQEEEEEDIISSKLGNNANQEQQEQVPIIEMVYAEDETVTTPINTPIVVNVTHNDFVKGMGKLILHHTGGAIHGKCRITKSNQLKYIPQDEFVGDDHCGYLICQFDMCDEGVLAIEVGGVAVKEVKGSAGKEDDVVDSSGKKKNEKLPSASSVQQEEQSLGSGSSGSSGLVSNYESSGGASILPIEYQNTAAIPREKESALQQQDKHSLGGLNSSGLISYHESPGGASSLSTEPPKTVAAIPSAAIHCQENNGASRNLLRGRSFIDIGSSSRRMQTNRKLLPKNASCVGSSLVTTTPTSSSDGAITYTSTYRMKKKVHHPGTMSSVLRSFGRFASTSSNTSTMTGSQEQQESSSTTTESSLEESLSYIETVITIPASADAIIMPGFPDSCFGNVPSMLVSSATSDAGRHETLLQFETMDVLDASSYYCPNGLISSAKIYVYSLASSSQGGIFITTSDKSWVEDEVTWNNAPQGDGIVLTSDVGVSVEARKWYGVDVSSALILGETLSIRIVPEEEEEDGGSVAQYASRDYQYSENGALLKPVLNITCLSLDVGDV
ncbi:hypothetical protein ACHAXR_012556 [Thalassiosira sp. AJA248-18]